MGTSCRTTQNPSCLLRTSTPMHGHAAGAHDLRTDTAARWLRFFLFVSSAVLAVFWGPLVVPLASYLVATGRAGRGSTQSTHPCVFTGIFLCLLPHVRMPSVPCLKPHRLAHYRYASTCGIAGQTPMVAFLVFGVIALAVHCATVVLYIRRMRCADTPRQQLLVREGR